MLRERGQPAASRSSELGRGWQPGHMVEKRRPPFSLRPLIDGSPVHREISTFQT